MTLQTLAAWSVAVAVAGQWGSEPRNRMPAEARDRQGFTICRLYYASNRTENGGSGWNTDYPRAEKNLLIRLTELTTITASWDEHDDPRHWVVEASSHELFRCPFLYASDAGTISLSVPEIRNLRRYLAKGGFLWFDDSWGDRAWHQLADAVAAIWPGVLFELLPPDDPILTMQYVVREIPQLSNLEFWRGAGHTRERGDESPKPFVRVVRDDQGRIVVLITHNTDIWDGFEREGDDSRFFYLFSPAAYGLGINVVLYSLTH